MTDISLLEENQKGRSDLAGQKYYMLHEAIHANDLKRVPNILLNICEKELWKKWKWNGSEFEVRSIDDYITAHPPKGLGVEIDLLYRLIADKPKVRDALDRARQKPLGTNQHNEGLYNIQTQKAPTGTSVEATLRRLRKHRPDLHKRVLNGELSANAAAIEAGFRKKPVKRCPKCGHEW